MIGLNHKIILAVKFSQSTVIIFQSMLISMTILSKQSLQDHFQTVCSVILSTKLAASDATLQSPKIRGGGCPQNPLHIGIAMPYFINKL